MSAVAQLQHTHKLQPPIISLAAQGSWALGDYLQYGDAASEQVIKTFIGNLRDEKLRDDLLEKFGQGDWSWPWTRQKIIQMSEKEVRQVTGGQRFGDYQVSERARRGSHQMGDGQPRSESRQSSDGGRPRKVRPFVQQPF